jgi:hypothetical protein
VGEADHSQEQGVEVGELGTMEEEGEAPDNWKIWTDSNPDRMNLQQQSSDQQPAGTQEISTYK